MNITDALMISVVVPVYNGETYLPLTISSLLAQSYPHFQLLLVDDGSTDGSFKIMYDFARNDNRLKVLKKKNGGTVAKALQYALPYIEGNYFMYASQDDLFSVDLLENTAYCALQTGADAVVPDMEFYFGKNKPFRRMEGWNGNRNVELSGREAFQLSLNWQIHGFVLWKMDLVRQVGYSGQLLNSDEFTTRMLYFHSKKVVFSKGTFYYRQNNPQSITRKWNPALPESFETCVQLEQFMQQQHFPAEAFDALYATILAEIYRIQRISQAAKRQLSTVERVRVENIIRQFYNRYQRPIRCLKASCRASVIKWAFFTQTFFLLQLYGSIVRLLHRIRFLRPT
jgi:hypothetical protein